MTVGVVGATANNLMTSPVLWSSCGQHHTLGALLIFLLATVNSFLAICSFPRPADSQGSPSCAGDKSTQMCAL